MSPQIRAPTFGLRVPSFFRAWIFYTYFSNSPQIYFRRYYHMGPTCHQPKLYPNELWMLRGSSTREEHPRRRVRLSMVRGLSGRKESRERSHEWRGSLGKRSQDGGLGEEETRGRVSPIEGQASSRSGIGESCPRKGLAGERGCHRGSWLREIPQGRHRCRGRKLRVLSLGKGAWAGLIEGAMPREGLVGDGEGGESSSEADGRAWFHERSGGKTTATVI